MKVLIQEIKKNNYTIDFVGIGVKKFEFNAQDIKEIIENDLHICYDCINYLSTMVHQEEGIYVATNFKDNTKLTIRLYMKTEECPEKENMLGVITSFLAQAFIN